MGLCFFWGRFDSRVRKALRTIRKKKKGGDRKNKLHSILPRTKISSTALIACGVCVCVCDRAKGEKRERKKLTPTPLQMAHFSISR